MPITRREFNKFAVSAIPAAGAFSHIANAAAPARVDSKVNGVQIGMNVPYNFDPANRSMPGDEILSRCVQLNCGALELRSQPVEFFLNAPTAREDLRKWRTALAMDSVKPFRRKFEDAGVMIHIVKFDNVDQLSDDEVDYSFNLASALGAYALSCEIDLKLAQRLAPFAEKHKMRVGFHGHTQATPEMFAQAMSYGSYICANLDIGHFLVGNKTSPVPFLKDQHDRITHIHIKDRKFDGSTVPFGQGDVPILEVLHTIRDNKWPIDAVIEFEYPVPTGSDRMSELAKCMQFCRTALQA